MNSVLITGGSGYFGHGLVKHLLDHNLCRRICIYSRGEFAQVQMREKFKNDERLRFFIGDVRDLARLTRAMAGCDLVVHGAALKRVEVGEHDAEEMAKTNVMGAINVVQAARDAGLGWPPIAVPRKVILLSSDKACSPLNCYGATKFVAEKIVLAANNVRNPIEPIFSVCRYGNVAGSTGSVIPTWRAQMQYDVGVDTDRSIISGRVTLTDPDATRFWMSREEAVKMVLWTAEHMHGGELVVPSLPAYRLGDLAEAMDLTWTLTGLGAGEKQHEQMISGYEAAAFWRTGDGEYWIANGPADYQHEVRQRVFSSHHARRMTIEELRQRLGEIE